MATSVYGAYFGAAFGVMLLAVLGSLVDDTLQRLNALNRLLVLVVNLLAAAAFAVLAPVDWVAVAVLGPATLIGGFGGANIARRLSDKSCARLSSASGSARPRTFLRSLVARAQSCLSRRGERKRGRPSADHEAERRGEQQREDQRASATVEKKNLTSTSWEFWRMKIAARITARDRDVEADRSIRRSPVSFLRSRGGDPTTGLGPPPTRDS